MKVLRERLLPREVRDLDVSQDPRDATGRKLCSQHGAGRSKQLQMESSEDCVSKKIEAVVCNGNGIVGGLLIYYIAYKTHSLNSPLVFLPASSHMWITPSKEQHSLCSVSFLLFQPDLESDLKRTVSELVAEALTKHGSFAGGKQTMTVSRFIILPPEMQPVILFLRENLSSGLRNSP